MQRASARKLCQTVLIASGVAIAQAVSGIAAAAVAPSGDTAPAPIILRGAAVSPGEDPPVSAGSDPPTILRGSPPSPARLNAIPSVCPAGLDYDASYGCVSPGYAYAPDYGYSPDYGYWPYYGFGWGDNGRRRGLHGAFIHRGGRNLALHLGRRTIAGFTHMGGGFAHAGGFGHR